MLKVCTSHELDCGRVDNLVFPQMAMVADPYDDQVRPLS